MKYLLVLGFFCQVYRKEPLARLFFNDRLLDEFNIKKEIEKNDLTDPYKLKHPLEPINSKSIEEFHIKSIPSLRFYELDVPDYLQHTDIRIDIDNDDNNFVNGFMTKTSWIQFKIFSFLPLNKKIYDWFKKSIEKKRFSKKYAWYRRDRYISFFNINRFIWKGKNGQEFNSYYTPNFNYQHKVGGSGSLSCQLEKKYGILSQKRSKEERSFLYSIDRFYDTNMLYDKYK